jgi:hypothetical protein
MTKETTTTPTTMTASDLKSTNQAKTQDGTALSTSIEEFTEFTLDNTDASDDASVTVVVAEVSVIGRYPQPCYIQPLTFFDETHECAFAPKVCLVYFPRNDLFVQIGKENEQHGNRNSSDDRSFCHLLSLSLSIYLSIHLSLLRSLKSLSQLSLTALVSQFADRSEEHWRLVQSLERRADWKSWGPYVSDRAWVSEWIHEALLVIVLTQALPLQGTVREDYSPGGDAWSYVR